MHLHHGPIDLLIDIDAPEHVRRAGERAAAESFDGLLQELVGELQLLRQPMAGPGSVPVPHGAVARRMHGVAARLAPCAGFITPMAAVAGAVADTVLQSITGDGRHSHIRRASVNNGGDIALFLAAGQQYRVGLVADIAVGTVVAEAALRATGTVGVRGIATSGWAGRSHSLGIADAVTVVAADAAGADGAATVIASATRLDNETVVIRERACDIDPDSDLQQRLVTVAVGRLDARQRALALEAGQNVARRLNEEGLIDGACIHLQGSCRVVGDAGLAPWQLLAAADSRT